MDVAGGVASPAPKVVGMAGHKCPFGVRLKRLTPRDMNTYVEDTALCSNYHLWKWSYLGVLQIGLVPPALKPCGVPVPGLHASTKMMFTSVDASLNTFETDMQAWSLFV